MLYILHNYAHRLTQVSREKDNGQAQALSDRGIGGRAGRQIDRQVDRQAGRQTALNSVYLTIASTYIYCCCRSVSQSVTLFLSMMEALSFPPVKSIADSVNVLDRQSAALVSFLLHIINSYGPVSRIE